MVSIQLKMLFRCSINDSVNKYDIKQYPRSPVIWSSTLDIHTIMNNGRVVTLFLEHLTCRKLFNKRYSLLSLELTTLVQSLDAVYFWDHSKSELFPTRFRQSILYFSFSMSEKLSDMVAWCPFLYPLPPLIKPITYFLVIVLSSSPLTEGNTF